METFLYRLLNLLSKEFTVMFTAILPIVELRGAIPVGITLGMSPVHSMLVSFVGSMFPVPILLFGIRPVFCYLRRTELLRGIIDKLTNKSLRKSENIIKYGFWGLIIFVAIPLPGTGVWSGALIAVLLDMRFKLAFPAILIGNFIAAIAVMTLSHGVIKVFQYIP